MAIWNFRYYVYYYINQIYYIHFNRLFLSVFIRCLYQYFKILILSHVLVVLTCHVNFKHEMYVCQYYIISYIILVEICISNK